MTINTILVIFTVVISLIGFNKGEIISKSLFDPWRISRNKEWSRFITHGFIHADFYHLLFNMIGLYSFGEFVLSIFNAELGSFGNTAYILFYISALFASSLYDYYTYKDSPTYRALGASGAVSAVIFTSILYEPFLTIGVGFFIPVPGFIFGPLYLLYCSYMSKRGMDNIGHMAHFWGAVYGFVAPLFFKPQLLIQFFQQIINR